MPATIALAATFAAAFIGGGAIVSTAVFTIVSAGIYGAIGYGLSLLVPSQKAPPAPRPEDVQNSVRQPAQPRARHYGRVKVSGPWVFADSKEGAFFKLLALGQGPIDAIEEYWVDDRAVTLTGGLVTAAPWNSNLGIYTRLGEAVETHYTELSSRFPEWTSAHTGDGVASLLVLIGSGNDQEQYFDRYPNGINTNFRVVLRGAKVLNPLTALTAWSDSAAAIVLDYMSHADGMRLPLAIFNTPLALAGWQLAATRCNETIARKAGGFESRYVLWGTYYLNERPADVLGRMLQCCDGRLYPTSDGGLKLDVGAWAEPTVTLDEDSIVGFSEFARGKDIINTANVISATYTGIDQDYQTADAEPWIDAVDVSERGEIGLDTSYIMSPSHGQTRRLMKLAAYRTNPLWVGVFQCNLRGMAVLGERFIRITYPQFDLDAVMEVNDIKFVIGEGNILQGVTISVQSMPEEAYEWNAAEEEGDAPVRDDTTVDHAVPVPTNFSVALSTETIGGVVVSYAILSFDAPPSSGLRTEAQGRLTTATSWTPIAVALGATTARSFAIDDTLAYEFQIRHVSLTGRPSEWSGSLTIGANPMLNFAISTNSQYLPVIF